VERRALVKALFDTNILIDYLAGRAGAADELGRYDQRLVSAVTWMEVQIGAANDEEADVIDLFLRDFRVIDITRGIARDAIELRRKHRVKLPDALVWASARAESALLVTRDTKAFPKTEPGVRVPY
jgi:predicted nucleic acid-binding protein